MPHHDLPPSEDQPDEPPESGGYQGGLGDEQFPGDFSLPGDSQAALSQQANEDPTLPDPPGQGERLLGLGHQAIRGDGTDHEAGLPAVPDNDRDDFDCIADDLADIKKVGAEIIGRLETEDGATGILQALEESSGPGGNVDDESTPLTDRPTSQLTYGEDITGALDLFTHRQLTTWQGLHAAVEQAVVRDSIAELEPVQAHNESQIALVTHMVGRLVDTTATENTGQSEALQSEQVSTMHSWDHTTPDGRVNISVRPLDDGQVIGHEDGLLTTKAPPSWPFPGQSELVVSSSQQLRAPENPADIVYLNTDLRLQIGDQTVTLTDVTTRFVATDEAGRPNGQAYDGMSAFIQPFIPDYTRQHDAHLSRDQLTDFVCESFSIGSSYIQTLQSVGGELLPADASAEVHLIDAVRQGEPMDATRSTIAAEAFQGAVRYVQQRALFDAQSQLMAAETEQAVESNETQKIAYAGALATFSEIAAKESNESLVTEHIDELTALYQRDHLPGQAIALARAYYSGVLLGNTEASQQLHGMLRAEAIEAIDTPVFSQTDDGSHATPERYPILQSILNYCEDSEIAQVWINRYTEDADRWEQTAEYLHRMSVNGQVSRDVFLRTVTELTARTADGNAVFSPEDILTHGTKILASLNPGEPERIQIYEAINAAAVKVDSSPQSLTRMLDTAQELQTQRSMPGFVRSAMLTTLDRKINAHVERLEQRGYDKSLVQTLTLRYFATRHAATPGTDWDVTLNFINTTVRDILADSDGSTASGDKIIALRDTALRAAALEYLRQGITVRYADAARDLIDNMTFERRNEALIESWRLARNREQLKQLEPNRLELGIQNSAFHLLFTQVGAQLQSRNPGALTQAIRDVSQRLLIPASVDAVTPNQPSPVIYSRLIDMLLDRLGTVEPRLASEALSDLIATLHDARYPFGSLAYQESYFYRLLTNPYATPADHAAVHRMITTANDSAAVKADLLARYAYTRFRPAA